MIVLKIILMFWVAVLTKCDVPDPVIHLKEIIDDTYGSPGSAVAIGIDENIIPVDFEGNDGVNKGIHVPMQTELKSTNRGFFWDNDEQRHLLQPQKPCILSFSFKLNKLVTIPSPLSSDTFQNIFRSTPNTLGNTGFYVSINKDQKEVQCRFIQPSLAGKDNIFIWKFNIEDFMNKWRRITLNWDGTAFSATVEGESNGGVVDSRFQSDVSESDLSEIYVGGSGGINGFGPDFDFADLRFWTDLTPEQVQEYLDSIKINPPTTTPADETTTSTDETTTPGLETTTTPKFPNTLPATPLPSTTESPGTKPEFNFSVIEDAFFAILKHKPVAVGQIPEQLCGFELI